MQPNYAAERRATSARPRVLTTTTTAPLTGLIAPVLLIGALAGSNALDGVGFSAAGWIVGLTCAATMSAGLARGLSYYRRDRLAPADWVTLVRATFAIGVAALVADSFTRSVPLGLLMSLTVIALTLDAVDGWVARRMQTTGGLGAHFDAEVDAFLILVLSVYVARSVGAWVLVIGLARYAFLAAGWALPWLRAQLPPRFWRKTVAATEGIVLAVAAADVLPAGVTRAALLGALILLAESFGRDVWWLRSHRDAPPNRPPADADTTTTGQGPGRGRVRAGLAAVLTALAFLFVWCALAAPDQPVLLKPGAFLRVPLEGLIVIALALALPAKARRWLAWVVGPVLALVVLLKFLNVGFFAAFNRPFDPYQDLSYAGIGSETLRASIGGPDATLVFVALAAIVVGLLVFMTLALRRVVRIAAGHRQWSLRVIAALGAVWVLCWAFGAHLVSHAPIASANAAGIVADEVSALRSDINDKATFAKEIKQDRFAGTPANQLLTGLRGKDVLLAVVESYGKVAVQGSSFSPQVDAVLNSGNKRLKAAGFSARSGFLTSPTFGGISWLAHSTLQSGVWVNTRRRYSQLTASNRFTLSDAFKRAGWRTVDDVPSNNRFWGPGKSFYHYDKVYDRRDVNYHGPTYAYASMPDQYVFSALQRNELAKQHRRPLFAEIDMVSSHTPWTRIPTLIPWNKVGNGSIFNHIPVKHTSRSSLSVNAAWAWLQKNGSAPVRAAYGQSIRYSLNTLISFVQQSKDKNLVMVVYGDHQPWTIVSGQQPSHEIPISIIARDPNVMKRISGWGWNAGLKPSPQAPVWPMSAFRDRFLSAFGPQPSTR
ncbi:MAG TPA: CDP-alcohol phosphatidyltransferase family protein [Thermoleophilaceae bacterium]